MSPAPGGQDFAAPAATGSAPAIPGTELSLGPAPAPAALGSPAVVRAAVDGAAGTPWAALLLGGALFTVGAVIAVWMMVRWRRHARTEAVYPEAGGAW